jgi:uncharacterized membrane protein YozB (DUF420 family)
MIASGLLLLSSVFADFPFGSQGMMQGMILMFLFLSVVIVSVFSFTSIAVWTEARRKEREAYYKAESLRRVAEIPGEGAKYMIEMMREEERIRQDRERLQELKKVEGMKVGGLVTIAVGVAMMIFMHGVGSDKSAYLVGLMPGLIGVALLISALFILPKSPRA